MRETEEFISLFKVIPFGQCLYEFGREKAFLTSIGRKIENFDMAIGATALQQKMVLVTDNISHMERIRGLKIENWRMNNPK